MANWKVAQMAERLANWKVAQKALKWVGSLENLLGEHLGKWRVHWTVEMKVEKLVKHLAGNLAELWAGKLVAMLEAKMVDLKAVK